jgi:DnaJ-class molecular chaperone
VGQKDKPKKQKCSGCGGDGGKWVVPNGNGFKKRAWVTCKFCKGAKYV